MSNQPQQSFGVTIVISIFVGALTAFLAIMILKALKMEVDAAIIGGIVGGVVGGVVSSIRRR